MSFELCTSKVTMHTLCAVCQRSCLGVFNRRYRPTAQYLGTWTNWTHKLRRWRSQGQDENSETASKDEALKAKGEQEEQIKELQDKYMRSLAEMENIRNRLYKQVQETKKFGIQGFARELLEVADILEKANSSVSEDDLTSGNKPLVALVEGLKLTEAELLKVLKNNGVVRIEVGDTFDPSLHEALFEVEGDKPGTVAVVSRQGYLLHDRTLRPARVGVVSSKA